MDESALLFLGCSGLYRTDLTAQPVFEWNILVIGDHQVSKMNKVAQRFGGMAKRLQFPALIFC